MSREELEKEIEDKGIKYADSLEYTISKFSDEEGCWSQVEQAYEKGALDFVEPREKRIAELEQENAELDCQMNRNRYCYSCKNATERCFKKEIGCPCGNYKSYKDEIAELKEKLEIEQNARGDWFGKAVTKDRRLTEAKEIIYDFYDSCKGNGTTQVNTGTRFIDFLELVKKAEVFLKESEERY